jgi:hypothetical protein
VQLRRAPGRIAAVLAAIVAGLAAATAAPAASPPLRFEPTDGRAAARFAARLPGHAVALAADGAWIALAGADRGLRMRFAGARSAAPGRGEDAHAAPSHHLRGADPAHWRRDVPAFARVRFADVYPGVDVVYYGHDGELEFDFVVAPGADLAAIELGFEGADAAALGADGAVALRLGARSVALRAPVVYQTDAAGAREPVAARWEARAGGRFGFCVGAHDRARPLVVDPVLSVATFLGGSGNDQGRAVATDATGAIYVVGETISLDFPTVDPLQPAFGGGVQDIVVAKLDPSGTRLVWSTYLGGSLHDRGFAIAVDAYGGVVVTGRTGSPDFPTVRALQPAFAGGDDDAFVAKLAPDGASLDFATYLGGSGNDRGLAVAVGVSGEIAVGGLTLSTDFPTAAPFQTAYGGGASDGFVAKLAADGSALRFASYAGGSASDSVRALALDADENLLVCGDTASADFPIAQALQPVHGGGSDAWVGRIDAAGTALAPATYLGGSGDDFALGCDATPDGVVVVAGTTDSPDLPLASPAQAAFAGVLDAFAAKFGAGLGELVWSTYLGGSATDFGLDVAVDAAGRAVVVGGSNSTDYPVVSPLQAANAGLFDTVVTRLAPGGAIEWSTYLGGSGQELAFDRMGVAIDPFGRPVLTGITGSTDHPLAVPLQPLFGGGTDDAFVARIAVGPEVRVALAPEAGGTRLRLALANGALATRSVELKLWIDLPGGATVGLAPEPLVVPLAPMPFATLVDALLPPAIAFPGARVGARLLDPATGAVQSESFCEAAPCP